MFPHILLLTDYPLGINGKNHIWVRITNKEGQKSHETDPYNMFLNFLI